MLGPAGLTAAMSANIRGASQTFVVETIMGRHRRSWVDCGVEAGGYQAHDPVGAGASGDGAG